MPSCRAHARIARWATALVAAVVLLPGPSAGQTFTGTYRVHYMGAALTLVLDVGPDGSVRGRLVGPGVDLVALGREATDGPGPPVVRGTLSAPGGPGGRFELSLAGDGEFAFLLVPQDAGSRAGEAGARRTAATRLSDSVPRSMLPPGAAGPPDRPERDRSSRLVGVWRTRVEESGDGAPGKADLFMELRADGVMVDLGSRPAGSGGADLSGGGKEAAWRVREGVLEVSAPGSPWVPLARYELPGDDRLVLTFPRDGTRQVWVRVR